MSKKNQRSVLIIESDEKILENLSARFKKRNMLVITARDGFEGYSRATSESPDLIVSETLLPSMNGFRVSRLLKFDERFKNTPLILMTSNNIDSVQEMFSACGADQILGKPFRFSELMKKITETETV